MNGSETKISSPLSYGEEKADSLKVKCSNEVQNEVLINSIYEDFRKEQKIMQLEICEYVLESRLVFPVLSSKNILK